ncbi:hypothetical protein AB1Y20_007417 [Prymnesium parvum]|uniref:Cysteinyl-tRNA ligase anticodon binding domain-containing protein n=1 Tax=Prymnesium parvum TaxID=97485 RepID=A0AB34IW13_PRYPA
MSRSTRANRRGTRSGGADSGVAAGAGGPADTATVLEAVRANPDLRTAHVIVRDLILKGIEGVALPNLRRQMTQTLDDMLAGKLGFKALQGTALEPLGVLSADSDGIVLPEGAWQQERLLGCLAEVASNNEPSRDIPPPVDVSDALLAEMTDAMDPALLRQTLEALHGYIESSSPMSAVVRVLVQLAQMEGPLRLLGPPTPCDLQTFAQHLAALANQLNTLHDPKMLGEHLQSRHFKRAKYELFALQHMQLLVWLQRVQQGLNQGVGKQGPELTSFVNSIGHAARVLLFQPLLLHTLQIMQTVTNLPSEEVPGSMQQAMLYPSESATDEDRVEWLQLNLLLQFQSVYRDALCNPSLYQPTYSSGEANLFSGFLRLEDIYTHLIGRFPACCPLSDQEQAVLTQMCTKLNRYFNDGKQIKQVLESQPQHGKQLLVNGQLASSVQYAVRDWILPFMMAFTDLLKVLWTLWAQLKRKQQQSEAQLKAVEHIARLVGACIVGQLAEEEAALRAHQAAIRPAEPKEPPPPASLPPAPPRGAAAAPNGLPAPAESGSGGWASVVRRPPVEPPAGGAALPAPKPAPPPPSAAAKPRSVSGGATDEAVRELVCKRESARFARDFDAADKLREQLSRWGITLDDQNKLWRAADGRSGPITAVNISELHAQKAAKSGAAHLPDEEIDRLVKEREQARFTSDYKTADRLRDQLEKHGVHLDTKENKWQAADGRSGPIGPVNISAAHAQKAARAGAPKLPVEEIEKILVQREQARARRDYKTADVLREQLEKHGVYLDANKWHSPDGRSGAIVMSSFSDEDVGKILASRQAARLRHDYKTADRLRDQLNEQCVSVDDKKNRWDASDGRSGNIEPFTCVPPPVPDLSAFAEKEEIESAAEARPAPSPRSDAAAAKGESKRILPEKARRELAKRLREATGASARLCEKALQAHADDMDRAAEWLLSQADNKAETNGN